MTVTTVFSTPASFLSFVSVQGSGGIPSIQDFAWGSNDPTSSMETIGNRNQNYDIGGGHGNDCSNLRITANYLILGFENEHFSVAYVAFPGHSSFDTATKLFLAHYGEPTSNDRQSLCRYWVGKDLNVRLQYQVDTDEGILAVTYQKHG